MEGYLLDTNHIIPLLRDNHRHRAAIISRLAAAPSDAPVCIATAALAELEVGSCFEQRERAAAQADIHAIIRENGLRILDFTRHTAAEYGALKAALMRRFNREGARRAAKWPEDWTSPVRGQSLGVDELDLLMISHAIERRLVLVTSDPMRRICEAVGEALTDLDFQDWVSFPSVGG